MQRWKRMLRMKSLTEAGRLQNSKNSYLQKTLASNLK